MENWIKYDQSLKNGYPADNEDGNYFLILINGIPKTAKWDISRDRVHGIMFIRKFLIPEEWSQPTHFFKITYPSKQDGS